MKDNRVPLANLPAMFRRSGDVKFLARTEVVAQAMSIIRHRLAERAAARQRRQRRLEEDRAFVAMVAKEIGDTGLMTAEEAHRVLACLLKVGMR